MNAALYEALDLRQIAPDRRATAVLTAFARLPLGGEIELQADQEPQALYHALRAELAGDFAWHATQARAPDWRVRLRKVGLAPGAGGCCGGCGGARR